MSDESESGSSMRVGYILMGVTCLIVAAAVARQVLPVPSLSKPTESIGDLQERLAAERAALRRSLQSELEDWERKNAELSAEIAVLEGEAR